VVLLGWITVRVSRQGIWADAESVIVRNVLRTYRFRWNDVREVAPPLPYGTFSGSGLSFTLRDGRRIASSLYAAGPFNRPGFADAVVEELEALRQAAHHDH
jgi:hypothetical protein